VALSSRYAAAEETMGAHRLYLADLRENLEGALRLDGEHVLVTVEDMALILEALENLRTLISRLSDRL
jgi:hypothetical protein